MEIEKLLTPEELAERLGVPLSWIYRHTAPSRPAAQRLPSVRLDRHLRFRPSEIEAWLSKSAAGTSSDAPADAEVPQDSDSRRIPYARRASNVPDVSQEHPGRRRTRASST